MNVNETISNEELNAVLTELFKKVEDMGGSIEDLSNALDITSHNAETALEVARFAKAAVKDVHAAPTNGWDAFNKVVSEISDLAIALAIIGACGFGLWLIVKAATEPVTPEKKEEGKIKIV